MILSIIETESEVDIVYIEDQLDQLISAINDLKKVIGGICFDTRLLETQSSPSNTAKGKKREILSTKETKERFRIGSTKTVLELFKSQGSPAFKVGKNWMVDEDDFKAFLLKRSKSYKG